MFEKQRNTAKYTKARPYIFIMYYKNRIMLTGENKTQTSKKQASKCKLGRKNKQSNQNMIQPNFYHVESSFSPVQFSRSVMSDSVIPWIAARQASLSLCIHIHYAYIFREYDIFYKHRILYFYTIVSLHNKVSDFIIFQGIFPTQGSNPGLQQCRQIPYQLCDNHPKCNVHIMGIPAREDWKSNRKKKKQNDNFSILMSDIKPKIQDQEV